MPTILGLEQTTSASDLLMSASHFKMPKVYLTQAGKQNGCPELNRSIVAHRPITTIRYWKTATTAKYWPGCRDSATISV